jgi:hypothetical protein
VKIGLIERRLHALASNWVGNKHLPTIIRQLNAAFDHSIIYFSSNRFSGGYYADHSVIVSGQYCPRIRGHVPENIIISLSAPKEQKKVILSKKGARNLEMKILRTIVHEYRHRAQQKKQGSIDIKQYKPRKDVVGNMKRLMYFGMPDEIDAHAHETTVESAFGFLNINRLRMAHKISWRESEAIFMYRKYFRKSDPKVWKKFLKKVYKNSGVTNG